MKELYKSFSAIVKGFIYLVLVFTDLFFRE